MRSDEIKHGPQRAPHRALLRALGVSDAEMDLEEPIFFALP